MPQDLRCCVLIKKSFRLGLTGPTGSGKSTAAKAALAWGARIVDADQVARQVVQPGTPCLEELAEAFGRDILLPGADKTAQRHHTSLDYPGG